MTLKSSKAGLPGFRPDASHLGYVRTAYLRPQTSAYEYRDPARAKPAVGDLLCFRIGNIPHHVGVCFSEAEFVHAIKGHGVVTGNLQDATWMKRLTAVYRPIEQ